MERMDPVLLELPADMIIQRISNDLVAIVRIKRESLLYEEGMMLLDCAIKIREKMPSTTVIIKTTSDVCSKTERTLLESGVRVEKSRIMF
ncbi:MAG: hypothetical protein ACOC2H_00315 [Spirochaetota bacterium]